MNSSKDINERIEFMEFEEKNLVGYTINSEGLDEFKKVLVLFNGNKEDIELELPSGTWTLVVNGQEVNELGIKNINEAKIELLGRTALVLVQK